MVGTSDTEAARDKTQTKHGLGKLRWLALVIIDEDGIQGSPNTA